MGLQEAFVRRYQELSPCQTEPAPAGSNANLPLAKAEPITSVDSASQMTYLRKGKKYCTTAVREESEKWERNSPTDTKISKEGAGVKRNLGRRVWGEVKVFSVLVLFLAILLCY